MEMINDELQAYVDEMDLTNVDFCEVSKLGTMALATIPSSLLPLKEGADRLNYRKRWVPDEDVERQIERRLRNRRNVYTTACRILDPLLAVKSDLRRRACKINEIILRCKVSVVAARVLIVGDPSGEVDALLRSFLASDVEFMPPGACLDPKYRAKMKEAHFDVVIGLDHSTTEAQNARAILAQLLVARRAGKPGSWIIFHLTPALTDNAVVGALRVICEEYKDGGRLMKPEISRATRREHFIVAKGLECNPDRTASLEVWLAQISLPGLLISNSMELCPVGIGSAFSTGLELLERLFMMHCQVMTRQALQITRMILRHKALVKDAKLQELQQACAGSLALVSLAQRYHQTYALAPLVVTEDFNQ